MSSRSARTGGGGTKLGRTETTIEVDAAPVSLWIRLAEWSRGVFGHPIVPVVIVPAVGAYVRIRRRYGYNHPAIRYPRSGPPVPLS